MADRSIQGGRVEETHPHCFRCGTHPVPFEGAYCVGCEAVGTLDRFTNQLFSAVLLTIVGLMSVGVVYALRVR
jgi:predicted nucleic acid-binding Zn ribbon protein